jgi:DNA-binding NarL/FixJ family response regulator
MDIRAPVTVVIARFEDLVAHGLRALIATDPHIAVAGDDIAHDLLAERLSVERPQVAIVNFGSLRTPAEVRDLAAASAATRVVVLANRPTPAECNQMLAFGATACLSKETQARDVLNAIHLASRGLHVLPRNSAELGNGGVGPDLLTAREADVLEHLQHGASNAQIALALNVGTETVRTHARNIYRKLGVSGRRELAKLTGGSPPPVASHGR